MIRTPLPLISHLPPGNLVPARPDNCPLALSQMAFLPAPWEGTTTNLIPAAAAGTVVSDGEPPWKKSCPPIGPEPCLDKTTPIVGSAFLPLTSGVETPFSLPAVPAETNPTGQQAPFPSLPQGMDTDTPQDTPPVPDHKSTGPLGPRKIHPVALRPQIGSFDPFTWHETMPRPVVSTGSHLLDAQRTKHLPLKKTPAQQQVEYYSDAE